MATANQGPTGGLTPHIQINDNRAAEAIDFYKAAFGAEEMTRMLAEDGKRIMHAHLHINGASLMLNDDFPEYRGPGATPEGPPAGTVLHLQVDNADTWFDRAVKAGASVRMPLQDMFWGDRYGHVGDPFGHVWSIAHVIHG
jgi:PhnB protein